jgi:hypothetical protein
MHRYQGKGHHESQVTSGVPSVAVFEEEVDADEALGFLSCSSSIFS